MYIYHIQIHINIYIKNTNLIHQNPRKIYVVISRTNTHTSKTHTAICERLHRSNLHCEPIAVLVRYVCAMYPLLDNIRYTIYTSTYIPILPHTAKRSELCMNSTKKPNYTTTRLNTKRINIINFLL